MYERLAGLRLTVLPGTSVNRKSRPWNGILNGAKADFVRRPD